MATVIEIKKDDPTTKFLKETEEFVGQSDKLKSFSGATNQLRETLEGLTAVKGKSLSKQKTEKILLPLKGNFDAKKYTGKIQSFGDGMTFQKKLRNEWQ